MFSNSQALRLLQITTIGLFVGRGWQHLAQSVPIRSLLWNEEWMRPLVEALTTLTWTDYVTSMRIDAIVDQVTVGFGVFYLFLVVAVIFIKKLPARWVRCSLYVASFFLFFLAFLYYLDKNYLLGQWWEYALQFMTPLFLSWYYFKSITQERLILLMKIAIAVTFTCHGLYAIGYYPVPGSFQSMLMQVLPITEVQAKGLLQVAGILDFIISITIFLPYRKLLLISLGYAVVWGALTTAARLVTNFHLEFWLESLTQWTSESLFRIPHFMIPMWLLLYYWSSKKLVK